MRHYYKSHGKHCYLRSFRTKCQKCGADVLYWECRHGSKVFFNYPPYGKLVRHYCRHSLGNLRRKKNFQIIVKTPKGLLDKESPVCHICGRIFKNTQNLEDHLKNLKKQDILHKSFYENTLKFETEDLGAIQVDSDKANLDYKPKFGRINFRKKG
ncbi:MAG: hypothetical protein ACFFBI_04335 [Promethearchaeota archaeon]